MVRDFPPLHLRLSSALGESRQWNSLEAFLFTKGNILQNSTRCNHLSNVQIAQKKEHAATNCLFQSVCDVSCNWSELNFIHLKELRKLKGFVKANVKYSTFCFSKAFWADSLFPSVLLNDCWQIRRIFCYLGARHEAHIVFSRLFTN